MNKISIGYNVLEYSTIVVLFIVSIFEIVIIQNFIHYYKVYSVQ